MFFWNSLAFSMIQRMLAIWSLVPLPFLKPAWTSGSSRFTYYWSLAWRILSITLLVREMSKPVWIMFSITCNERVPTAVLSQSQRSHCILIARVFSSKSSHPVHGCCWVSHVQVLATKLPPPFNWVTEFPKETGVKSRSSICSCSIFQLDFFL